MSYYNPYGGYSSYSQPSHFGGNYPYGYSRHFGYGNTMHGVGDVAHSTFGVGQAAIYDTGHSLSSMMHPFSNYHSGYGQNYGPRYF